MADVAIVDWKHPFTQNRVPNMPNPLIERTKDEFLRIFGGKPEVAVMAPGRVNLIGEHTDYNEGFVLPAAVDRGTALAGEARDDRKVVLYSADYRQQAEFSLDSLFPDPARRWADYVKGVADQLQRGGFHLKGFRAVLKGDLPRGAGLSSSASLEVAAAVFFQKTSGLSIPDLELVKAAQAAENAFVGVQCGIMDPFASHLGKAGRALFLDCRSLEHQWAPVPPGWTLAVCDSGVERTLAGSAYNERRRQCEEGVRALAVGIPHAKSLRDISLCDIEKHGNLLGPVVLRRCRHVVSENQRVLDMVEALKDGRLERVKVLMEESHESLRDDYGVSCPELDLLVELARNQPGLSGSRMTGAGFGGCTLHLVKDGAWEAFKAVMQEGYEKKTGIKPGVYAFRAADGAKILNGG